MRFFLLFLVIVGLLDNIEADSWKIVAHVNDLAILNSDVMERAELFKKINNEQYKNYFINNDELFMKEMQSLLINEILLLQEAERFNISVSDSDIFTFLIEQGFFQNVEMIHVFAREQNINPHYWFRSVRFYLLIERFKQIFFSKEAFISSDEKIILLENFIQNNKVYHIKMIDNIDEELKNITCQDFLDSGKDFSLYLQDMNDELYHNLYILQKENFALQDKKKSILLCEIEEKGDQGFDKFIDAVLQQRIVKVVDEFFIKLQRKYVIFSKN